MTDVVATAMDGVGAADGAAECAILLNYCAGAFRGSPCMETVRAVADEVGLRAAVLAPPTAFAMREAIRELVGRGARRIAVAGGDGTIALAAQELAGTDTALGILAQGTANNFAVSLRLPTDLTEAVRILRDGVVYPIDLGRVNGRYFTEAAGVGLFADFLAEYNSKSNTAYVRAVVAAVRTLLGLEARRVRLTVDGRRVTERAILCTAANGARMGNSLPVAPDAKLTDGLLDVVVVGDVRPAELFRYYRALRAQRHLALPEVTTLRAREVRIESRRPMKVHCDDEIVGMTPVTITSCPGALKVIVPTL